MKKLHIPVLLSEVLAGINPQPGESYLDLTAGYGGHASEILDATQNYKDSVLVDRDEFAVNYLKQKFPPNTEIKNTDFYSAVLQLIECGKQLTGSRLPPVYAPTGEQSTMNMLSADDATPS